MAFTLDKIFEFLDDLYYFCIMDFTKNASI